ncbi:MAG: TIGR01777 family oxidoreductase [Porticoccaceae bacterium]
MKSILITGGSGFIGRHLSLEAIAQGWQVIVLTRNIVAAAGRLPAEVRLIESLDSLGDEERIDAVVNLAGEPLAAARWTEARKQQFIHSRVETTEALYQFFLKREQRPEVVVSGSAIGFYGAGNGQDMPVDESATAVDNFSHQLCGRWEQSAEPFASLGIRLICLRTGIVLGEEGALAKMLPPFRLGLGGPVGDGQQWMPWIHIRDMVALILHCVDRTELSGPVNATAPNPVRNRDFSRQLGAALHRPAILPMPGPLVRLLFGQMGDELLLQGQRVIPRKVQDSGFNFQYPLLDDALDDLLHAS